MQYQNTLLLPAGGGIALDAALVDAARRAMSANSCRALRADIRIFAGWCSARGEIAFPARPECIARFVRDQGDSGKKPATLVRYVSSIARLHALAGSPDPTRAGLVRLELKAQRRIVGVRQRQAKGLRYRGDVADPRRADSPAGICVLSMLAGTPPETMDGARNRALLSLAFDTGLRRSEIVATRWSHVEAGSGKGGRLFVPRAKGDQEAAGCYAYLSPRSMALLAAWREMLGPGDGPVFRRLHRSRDREGRDVWTPGTALSAQSVTLVYRAMLDRARAGGLFGQVDDAEYARWRSGVTAHSTRVGLTQDLFASGEDLAGIMHALRWKSPTQPARYTEALAVEANAAARVVSRL